MAQQYCVECKTIYAELSKIIQNVMASRRELVKYDTHKGEGLSSSLSVGSPLMSPSPMTSHPGVSGTSIMAMINTQGLLDLCVFCCFCLFGFCCCCFLWLFVVFLLLLFFVCNRRW